MKRILNTLLLGVAVFAAALSAAADPVREDELDIASDKSVVTDPADPSEYQTADLRSKWPVETLGEIELPYSAVGWDESDPLPAGATVRLNLLEGTFVGGKFSPGSLTSDLATGLTGTGTYVWQPSGVDRRVYRILHETTRGSAVVDDGTVCAYYDFTDTEMMSAKMLREAVLGVSQPVALVCDGLDAWSLVGGAGDGVRSSTDGAAFAFAFRGAGALCFEYDLTGGALTVKADGKTVFDLDEPTGGWVACVVPFSAFDAHNVAFSYTAAAGGAVAIRNVRWEMPLSGERASAELSDVTTDLQVGVRTPRCMFDILPFAYSSTNWIGDVAGVTEGSVARVAVVELTGTDPCVTNWTEEVAGTYRVLKEASGEGEVAWRGKRMSVWKATFDILNGDSGIHRETVLFDLRKTKASAGLILMVR